MGFNFNPGNIYTFIIISYNIFIFYIINYYFVRLYTWCYSFNKSQRAFSAVYWQQKYHDV